MGPLFLLLLFAGPRTLQAWSWVIACGIGLAFWAVLPGGLEAHVAETVGIIFTGFFVGSVFIRPTGPTLLARLGFAVGNAFLGTLVWAGIYRISVGAIVDAVANATIATAQTMLQADPAPSPEVQAVLQTMIQGAPTFARLSPGILVLAALAGGALSWKLYHWVAARPLGTPPGPFTGFRFNDHLIWPAMITLGVFLLPLPERWQFVAGNGLIIWIGLYLVRGTAVLGVLLTRIPVLLRFGLLLGALVLLPFALGGLLALGLADTWVDLRRRIAPPSTSS